MRYLITGANGQLGTEWVEYLTKKQADFTAFGSDELDITDKKSSENKILELQPDVLINCAAYTKVDKAEKEERKAYLVNELGVQNLMQICESAGIKLVHYSTDYVFSGAREDRDKYPAGYPETAPKSPLNMYGKSKRAGEIVLENRPGNWLLIRVSWLCGAYGNNFVKTMLRLSKQRETLSVVKDQYGSPTFTFDVVRKTDDLLEMNKNGVFHVSSSGMITWAEFAQEIFNISGTECMVEPIPSEDFETDARRPFFSLLSTQKIETEGLEPIKWKIGLNKLINQLHS